MTRKELLKSIMLYLLTPEDTTETGCYAPLIENVGLSERRAWLGPLKTVIWVVTAIAGPLSLCTLLV